MTRPTRIDPIIASLRERREKLGLSLRIVADKAGYEHNTMWHWETGKAMPAFQKLHDWAEALGMRIELVEIKSKE